MTARTTTHSVTNARAAGMALRQVLSMAGRWMAACDRRRRQRLALARMDDWQLRDIGLERVDMRRETDKWPWSR